MAFTESIVESAALAWPEALGYAVAHSPELAPDKPRAERADFGQLVLVDRLRRAMAKWISGVLRVTDAERIAGRAL